MHNKYIFILCFLLISFTMNAQFDENTFFKRANNIYYNLSNTNINNYAVLITSDYFEYKTGKKINHDEYSPVEFIWVKPNQLYFNRNKIPAGLDSAEQVNVAALQNEMFQELRGIFMDWQRFIGGKILYDMPEEYKVDVSNDTVHVMFDTYENNSLVKMKLYFGLNALCFRIVATFPEINQKIITYPTFTLIDKKWLCTEWIVKIVVNGEIESGFKVSFKSAQNNQAWLPVQALIQVQTKQKPNQTFSRLYKFRNLRTNVRLQAAQN